MAQHEGLRQSGLERIEKAERVVPQLGYPLKAGHPVTSMT
jgi:hypothetical protein